MQRTRQIELAAWGMLAASIAAFAWWGVYLPLRRSGYDFTGPYEAAYALAHHATFHIYNVTEQRAFNDTVLHLPDGPSDFRWPPPMAALLMPLGLLPYSVAHLIWWFTDEVAVFVSLWLLARCMIRAAPRYVLATFRRLPVLSFAALFCVATWNQGVIDSLRLGQSTPFMLLGFALLAYGELQEKPALAGCGLALAALEKLFPAALLIYFLWRGKYRQCIALLALVAIIVVITLPATGTDLYRQFIAAIGTYSGQPNGGPVNISLFHAMVVGISFVAYPGQPESTGRLLQLTALLACTAPFAWFLFRQGYPSFMRRPSSLYGRHVQMRRPEFELLNLSWATVSLLLLEPITWMFYHVLLLVPAAWLTLSFLQVCVVNSPARSTVPSILGFLCLLIASVPLPLDSRVQPPMSPLFVVAICYRPLALAGLWLCLAWIAGARNDMRTGMIRRRVTPL
jgi:Glycosyltransferase family 87